MNRGGRAAEFGAQLVLQMMIGLHAGVAPEELIPVAGPLFSSAHTDATSGRALWVNLALTQSIGAFWLLAGVVQRLGSRDASSSVRA
ncbi:MAG: hypothetical protein AAGE52_14565 [Myxococcota bacterium]